MASRIAKCYSFARGTFKCPCVLGVLPEGARKGREMGERLTQEQRKALQEANVTIIRSFDWATSRMGYSFWAKVYCELDRILTGAAFGTAILPLEVD